MTPNQALLTIHADYIGGQHANYRKWYFAAQLNLDDAVGQSQNPGLQRLRSVKGQPKTAGTKSLDSALNRWRNAMNNMSQYDRLRQIALWLLCWGEAGNVRLRLNVLLSSSSARTITTVVLNVKTAWTQFLKVYTYKPSSSPYTTSCETKDMKFPKASSFEEKRITTRSSVMMISTSFSGILKAWQNS